MKWYIPGAALLGLAAAFSLLPAQQVELIQPQSLPKPAPAWLKVVDQGKLDRKLRGYFLPEGFKVEIVADYPTVTNPVGMTFADDGTLYVLEWRPDPGGSSFPQHMEKVTYRDGTTRLVATMKKSVKDVVKILRDSKDRGVYDRAEVILKEELPSSILLHDGWLYLSGRGTVRRYRQSQPGGPFDVREVIAKGFCGFHHHQVSGMTIGNDGWLYLTSGDDDNIVEGSDGSRATVLRTGAVFRCRPDGSHMEVYSLGYRNPYRDVAFDTAFHIFHADNDNEDGSKFTGCRLMHVAEEADFGWRLRTGARCCSPDNARGAVFGELPGRMPAMLKTGRGAPAGLLIYNDTRLPENYRGLLFYPDVFRKLIRAYRVEPRGATFEVAEEFEFMKSDDPLFRPCQMVLGPDGAIYVCDWRTNSGGAGQLWGDGRHGRIYRITWAGTPDQPAIATRAMDSWQRVVRSSDEELLKALAAPDFSDRRHAQQELTRRGDRNLAALLRILGDEQAPLPARIASLGVLQAFWNPEVQEAFIRLLDDDEAALRRLAADGLALCTRPRDQAAHAALLARLGDVEPEVRRAVALAIGRVGAPGAADSLVNAYRFDESHDVYLRDGLVRAIERLGTTGVERLVALAESGNDRDRSRAVEAFRTLRSRAGAAAIPTLLMNPHLTTEQRVELVQSYGNYLLDPPVALEPLVRYTAAHPRQPKAVTLAVVEVLALGDVAKGAEARDLLLSYLEADEAAVRLAAVQTVEADPFPAAGPVIARIMAWSRRPLAERVEAARALRVLNDRSAEPALKEILAAGTPAEDKPLKLEALRTLAWIDPPAARKPALALLQGKDPAIQRDAIFALGAQTEGARLVGGLFLAKKIPQELLPQVTDALKRHATHDPETAKLLSEVISSGLVVHLTPDRVAELRTLAATKGDPRRGKALFLNTQKLACLTCHRLEGVGGNVGPDLTRMWDTQSLDKILESILEPSKEIKEGYQTYVATTRNGQVFTGLKVAQTKKEVVLRDANAKEIRIPAEELEELEVSKQSLMPENAVAQLSFDEFVDLLSFLKDRRAQESLQEMVKEFWVAGPFPGGLDVPAPPEKRADPAEAQGGNGKARGWQPRRADASGLLGLRDFASEEKGSVYALTFLFSPRAEKATLLVGSAGPVKIWVNGTRVHESRTDRPARPDDDRVEVSLKEGWNPVLLKTAAVPESGLYLRVTGAPGARAALKADVK